MSLLLQFRGESVKITPNGQSLEILVCTSPSSKITKKSIKVEFTSPIIDMCLIPTSRTDSLSILIRFSSGELGFIHELNLEGGSTKCQLLVDNTNNSNTKLFDAVANNKTFSAGRMNCVKISSKTNQESDGSMFRLVASTNTKLHYVCFILQKNNILKGLVKHDYTVKFENDDEIIYEAEFVSSSSVTFHSQVDFIVKTRNRTLSTQRIFPLSLRIQQQHENNNNFFNLRPVPPLDSSYFEFVASGKEEQFQETKYHQLFHNSRKIGIAVALTNPFLISVYSHKSIIGTVPLPVKYRNASCAHSSLRRRGDEASATMSAIYWNTQQIDDVTEGNQDDGGERKNSSSLILVTVVYEDFDTATVICLSLKNVPSSSQFSTDSANNNQSNQNSHYYVEIRGTWNLSLTNFHDSLFRRVEKLKMEVQSETECSPFQEYKQRILTRLLCRTGICVNASPSKDPCVMFNLWMTLNDENSTGIMQQHIQRFDLVKSNEKDSDDDGLMVGPKNIFFGSFSSTTTESQRRDENITLINAQEVIKQKHQLSLLEIEHPPAISLFEYSFLAVVETDSASPSSSSSLLVNFHRELLEISCWKRKTIDQLQSKQGEKYQRAIHHEELCRIFLPRSAKIKSVEQVFDEKGSSVFQLNQQQSKVLSCCFIVDDEKHERFVVVMIFHAELGAQLIPLAQFTKADIKSSNSERFQLKTSEDSNISLGISAKNGNEVLLQVQRNCTGLNLHPFSCNL